jgi:hypothetical protein
MGALPPRPAGCGDTINGQVPDLGQSCLANGRKMLIRTSGFSDNRHTGLVSEDELTPEQSHELADQLGALRAYRGQLIEMSQRFDALVDEAISIINPNRTDEVHNDYIDKMAHSVTIAEALHNEIRALNWLDET